LVLDHDELLGAREMLNLFGKAIGISHCGMFLMVLCCIMKLKCRAEALRLVLSFEVVRRWLCTLDPSIVFVTHGDPYLHKV
jgi:hypothetical protein